MARSTQIATHKQPFDEERFSKMVEPFTVRVEKVRGMARTPIALPPSDDPTIEPGTNWSAANIRGIENWLVTEWSGGGLYEISIVDVQGQTMKWTPWFDPNQYPEKIPPTMQDATRGATAPAVPAASSSVVIPFAQPQQPQVRPMSAFPHGLPQSFPMMAQAQPQQGYAYAPPQYQIPPPPPVGTPGWNAWSNEAENRRREDELRGLREREAAREREAMDAKHRAELERVRAENAAQVQRQEQTMNEMRSMVAQLTASLQQAQARPAGDSPELIALRAQLAQQQAALDAQTREREAERRDTMMREAMRQSQEATQKQIDALMRQMELQAQAAREAATNRPDQMVMILQQMSRDNAEALKAMSVESARSLERLQGFMMTPQAMFDLASKQSQSMENATDKVARTFGTVMDMQQRVIENAIQLAPGGTSGVDLAREGIEKVAGLVERYTTNKSTEARFAMDAQVRVAQAQAAAVAAQMGQPIPPTVYTPPAPVEQSQLNGAPAPNGQPAKGPKPSQVERFGRTDQEWFGSIVFVEVAKLRAGAARFIESLEMTPPRMKGDEVDGVSPEQAAIAIGQAIQLCMQNNIQVQALTDLLFADRFADFIAVTLPDAPQAYRDDATKALISLAQQAQEVNNGGEIKDLSAPNVNADDDDDDDDADGDDDAADDDDGTDDSDAPPELVASEHKTTKPLKVKRLH